MSDTGIFDEKVERAGNRAVPAGEGPQATRAGRADVDDEGVGPVGHPFEVVGEVEGVVGLHHL